ncbi:transcription regulator [Latilactobacillus fuchuensis DSM 14340 = JCM 11249]|uniref:Transcription regulator n=1 Tax=Latilactobacillus fuchuensis DSM 14340 = JCM 11249 TaxID=1423747 RepID=A0A0R1S418_9LACO|nr:transcription regulator [Latilactobacillus fuchuensis DSM 14340 = JCM 11249]
MLLTTNANKYLQIFETLKSQIWTGEYVAGQQLPSENELAKTYQVSRITSKRALQELADIGLVERHQGSGTFVRRAFKHYPRTNQLLLVIPFASESGLGDYITGVKEILAPLQQSLVVIENKDFTFTTVADLATQYDGLIYYPQNLAAELPQINQLLLHHFPFVLIDKTATNLPVPSVVSDNTQGGYLATNTLIEAGHQNIAFLAQSDLTTTLNSSATYRYFGYIQALGEHDLTFATTPHSATALTSDHFADLLPALRQNNVTALVCEHDILALQLLTFLTAHNVKVPETLSVIGFDNIAQTATSQPQLTTIMQNFCEIGRQAARLLQTRMANPYDPKAAQITVPVELMARLSVNPEPTI